jgi:CRISPR-associated helicase Cas3
MHFMVETLRYARLDTPFVNRFNPYPHQVDTLKRIREAIKHCQTICIENTSVTGSGKTLANFAATILDGIHTCGVYPTNELMSDQGVSLYPYLGDEITFLDGQGLIEIRSVHSHMRTNAHALHWATGEQVPLALLTNPDVLYLVMYNLYGQMFSTFGKNFGDRGFQNMLTNYPVIAFDEFHLYNAKQAANAAFIMGTMKELAPDKPHVFIFSSATPQEQFKEYVRRLGLSAIPVTDTPSHAENSKVVCEPIHVHLFPADLLRWKGGDAIRDRLETILRWAKSHSTLARGVFIVDSVYEAKRIAADLRQYGIPPSDIGEVHGYMASEDRARSLLCHFSVGTTTIDVGVNLTDKKHKDFLVCEARSAAQAIQRLGRIGRDGREPEHIAIPNTVWLAVPEHVYKYIQDQGVDETTLTRQELNLLLEGAYLPTETFFAYTRKYSPLEAAAACERIQQQHFTDTASQAMEKMHRLIPTLYDRKLPGSKEQTEKRYTYYHKEQQKKWSTYGVEVKGSHHKNRYFLSDLESFRGGLESDFTVAVYDELDKQLGMIPVKTYTLPFIVRRTKYTELTKEQFFALLKEKHPQQGESWQQELECQPNLLGYIHVERLIDEKENNVYFEIRKSLIGGIFHQVIRLQGLTIGGDNAQLRTNAPGINETLKKRSLNCWVSEHNNFTFSDTKHLPPLFAIYPLHLMMPNGKYNNGSIAFGLDAFLLESISKRVGRIRSRSDNSAIIL